MKWTLPFVLLAPACAGIPAADPPGVGFEARGAQWRVEFLDLMRPHGDETPPRLRVSIMKDDPEAGWVEWSGVYRTGQQLGWDHGAQGGRSHHRVFSGKLVRYVTVDFDSGWTIRDVVLDRAGDAVELSCSLPRWPAPPQCLGPALLPVRESGVVLENKSGDKRVYFQKQVTLLVERLCRDHGGLMRPGMWIPALAQQQREANAQYWLCWADWEWRSTSYETLSRAREVYRMLLENYGSEKAVRDSVERITSRAGAQIGN